MASRARPPAPIRPVTVLAASAAVFLTQRAAVTPASGARALPAAGVAAQPSLAAFVPGPAPRANAAALAPASPPDAAPEAAPGVEYAEHELILELDAGRDPGGYAASVERAVPGARARSLPGEGALWVTLPASVSWRSAAGALASLPGVSAARGNALARGTSNDREWAGREVPWNVASVRLPSDALPATAGGPLTVAVLDSGIAYRDYADPDGTRHARAPWLAGVELIAGPDTVHGDDNPDDRNNHGTHVASMLVGPLGMARGARLMAVQVLDEQLVGSEASLVAGLDWAVAHGARVVNLSLAFGPGYYPSRTLDRAVSRALRAGVVLSAAAGNDAREQVRFPAAFPGVIAVGAATPAGPSNRELAPARYTSRGPELDLLAPGGDLEADADRDGIPDGVLGFTFDPAAPDRFGPWIFAGTSQAAAHASAAAAHLLARGVSPFDVEARLCQGSRPREGRAFDPASGAGLLDVRRALGGRDPEAQLGVQLAAALQAGPGGARRMAVSVVVLDHDGARLRDATVWGRFRGAAQGLASCATGRDGACTLSADLPAGAPGVASLEVSAVLDATGRARRPAEVFLRAEEVEPVTARLAATPAGTSAIVLWSYPQPDGSVTYMMRSLALNTALPPTVLALDGAALERAQDGTAGTGFGFSSYSLYTFSYDASWSSSSYVFSSASSTSLSGTGFGFSSLGGYVYSSWSAWSWGAWGTDAALAGAAFAPGELLDDPGVSRAASVGAVQGAGRGMALP